MRGEVWEVEALNENTSLGLIPKDEESVPVTRQIFELVGDFILRNVINGEIIESVEWEGHDPYTMRLTEESIQWILKITIARAGYHSTEMEE